MNTQDTQNKVGIFQVKDHQFSSIIDAMLNNYIYVTNREDAIKNNCIADDKEYFMEGFEKLDKSVKGGIHSVVFGLGVKTLGFEQGDFYMIVNFGRFLEDEEIEKLEFSGLQYADAWWEVNIASSPQNTMLFITESY